MEFYFQSNSLMNSLKCPKAKSLSRCLTELIPIYQKKIWTIRWWANRTIVTSSHRIKYVEDCRISCNHHILWADFNSIQILCNLHLDIFATVVHLQERGGKAKGRMVTHFQSHIFSFTISFFHSLFRSMHK